MAVQDFDEGFDEGMEFKIGGESFKMRKVRPEVLAAWEDEPIVSTAMEALEQLDKRIKLFLDQSNGAAERWDDLRSREENAISQGQVNALLMWMVERQTGRPTSQPSPSASGRGKTAASSKGA